MKELIIMAINLHLLFIGVMIFIDCINLYFATMEKDFTIFAKKVNFIVPLYYSIMAALLLSGFVILGVNKMQFSLDAILMIIIWLVVLMLSIKTFKRYKKTKTFPNDISIQKEFRSFAKRKYIIDIALLSLLCAFVYLIK